MPKGIKKNHLPEKICIVCNRPFTWRKKWEKVWDYVQYCSKKCQNNRKISFRGKKMDEFQSHPVTVMEVELL